MFDSLTPAQKTALDEYRDTWYKIATDTGEEDRTSAEAAISRMYVIVGLAVPKFVWCESPHHANLLINEELKNPKDKMTYYHTTLWGSLDAYWIAFYLYCRDVLAIEFTKEQSESLDLWATVAKSNSWWYPFDTHCFICRKPKYLNLDAQGRFSSTTEPALGYKDGWSVYAIGGVIVPDKAVTDPEQITIEEIDKETNAEVRRLLISQMGIGKYIRITDAKLIHTDTITVGGGIDQAEVTLARALIRDKHERQYLIGTDTSTDRVYHMPVDPAARTCAEAHASINGGLDESDCLGNG